MLTSPRLDLISKIKILNERLWEHRVSQPDLDQWLSNFSGYHCQADIEQNHALLLLSKFLYFGHAEVHELLRAMFQDLIRQPLSVKARSTVPDKHDFDAIHQEFLNSLSRTRFAGVGNPAESGTHILYQFRAINSLPVDYFITIDDLFSHSANSVSSWANSNVRLVIFIDDFCGTGHQVTNFSHTNIPRIRAAAKASGVDVKVWYLTMLAASDGLDFVRHQSLFDHVQSVSELDDTYRAFGESSQCYNDLDPKLTAEDGQAISSLYGEQLLPGHSLGYGDCQLLVGFHHNTPDNTLPIFWQTQGGIPWHAIFPRIPKVISAGMGM